MDEHTIRPREANNSIGHKIILLLKIGTRDRIDEVSELNETRQAFIRVAIDREIARRRKARASR